MKKAVPAAIIVIAFVALAFWWGGRDPVVTPAASGVGTGSKSVAHQPAFTQPPSQSKAAPPVQPAQDTPKPPPVPASQPAGTPVAQAPPGPRMPPPPEDEPARQEADDIARNIRHFGQRFGGNPVGSNAEIVKTLTGDNNARAKYLTGDLVRLNDKGELIDQWGTPYFFHQNSATDMEVRSAGPDKILHNADDIVTK